MSNTSQLVRWGAGVALLGLLAACGSATSIGSTSTSSSSSSSGSEAASGGADVLGTPKAASGDPIVFGMLNLETGPVTFPEARLGAEAAVKYVNSYKGGIGGRPIKIVSCATDGQPATSQRCANQILDSHPVAILGAADSGAPGAMPVWERANLAYIGGASFTPAELTYKNGVIFSAISGADNTAGVVHAQKTLGAKSAVVIATQDTQGKRIGDLIVASAKGIGMTQVKELLVPPTAADVSSTAAATVTSRPDLVFVTTPVGCASMLKSLKQLGSTAKVFVIDPCTDPRVTKAAGDGAEGMYFAAPVDLPGAATTDAKVYAAAVKKFAPADLPLNSQTAIAFQSVMNLQAALDPLGAHRLTTDKILAAFRTGSNHANFLGHPYTCDGKQLPGSTTICNAHQQIRQYTGGSMKTISTDYVDPAPYFRP